VVLQATIRNLRATTKEVKSRHKFKRQRKRMKRKPYLTEEKLTGAKRRFLSRANSASLMRQAI